MRSEIKVLRLLWVCLTNGLMIYESAPSNFSAFRSSSLMGRLWLLHGGFTVIALICGMVLEVRASRWAKYVNIAFYSYYALLGTLAVLAAQLHLWGFTNESWIFFYVIGLPCLVVAVINYFLYRGRATPAMGESN